MGFLDAVKSRLPGAFGGFQEGGVVGGIFGAIKARSENRAQSRLNQQERELSNIRSGELTDAQKRIVEDIITGRQGLEESLGQRGVADSTIAAEARLAQQRDDQARLDALGRARRRYEIGQSEAETREDLAKSLRRTGYMEEGFKQAAALAAGVAGGMGGGAGPTGANLSSMPVQYSLGQTALGQSGLYGPTALTKKKNPLQSEMVTSGFRF